MKVNLHKLSLGLAASMMLFAALPAQAAINSALAAVRSSQKE